MAQTALPAPAAARRRAFFGLFDANGWGWASAKALFWFVVIITMLGYIPDRAYYFTVGRTVELWPFSQFLHWAPVNFCPPENRLSVCPVPVGATLPWDISPDELALPEGRTDGGAAILGSRMLYIGGSNGTAATDSVYVADSVGTGNITAWQAGPALPEPRTDAGIVTVGNTVYVLGGTDASGAATTTVYRLSVANDGTFSEWEEVTDLELPAARTGASAVSLTDGIMLIGGADANGPVTSTWKSTANTQGVLGEWEEQSPLFEAVTDALGVHVGDYVYMIGGRNGSGASGAVQVLQVTHSADAGGHGATTAAEPEVTEPDRWGVNNTLNLPAPRANVTGFTVNGVVYVIGGTDGTSASSDVLWTIPNADGTHPGWKHLDETDLGDGVQGAAAVASGANAFLVGGTAASGVTADLARTNLAPQDPFFQLGILGATVPGLRIEGEIGQQLGYLNAAGAGTVNFIVLLLIGWAFNNPVKARALVARVRGRRSRE